MKRNRRPRGRYYRYRQGDEKKPAQPTDQKPNNSDRPKASSRSDLKDGFERLMAVIVIIMTLPIKLFAYLTRPPGSSIILGLGVIYFVGLSIEGYWQSVPGEHLAFLPKPFIDDDASLINLFPALIDPSFWLSGVLAILIQVVQALAIRENIEHAKAQYEAVRKYQVPDVDPKAIDLAEHRRQAFKRAGMKTAMSVGFAIVIAYMIDSTIGVYNFPLFGLDGGIGELLRNLVWVFLSVVGAEIAIALFLNALDGLKLHPRTTVVQ